MWLVIILAAILIVGVGLCVLAKVFEDTKAEPALSIIGGLLTMCAFIALFISAINIVDAKTIDAQRYVNEREYLINVYECKTDDIAYNAFLYDEIMEFNSVIKTHKNRCSSTWLNWFGNPEVAAIDYIEFENKKDVDNESS